MRRLIRALGAAALAGGALGGLTHLADAPAAARAASALILVLVTAPVAALASTGLPEVSAPRVSRAVGAALLAGWTAEAAAVGGLPSPAAALVPASGVLLTLGLAAALVRLRVADGIAVGLAGALPFALAAAVFVANPFVEWTGSEGADDRAARVIALSPVPAMLALDGGAGLDWQTSRWLYDGPRGTGDGLSVIGQYYPARPPSPWSWALVSAVTGAGLLVLAGRGRPEPAVS